MRFWLTVIITLSFIQQIVLNSTTDTFLWDQVREARVIKDYIYHDVTPPAMASSIGGTLSGDYYYLNGFLVARE